MTPLFLDKVLLSARADVIRGVELFNLNLMADLAALGHAPLAPVHANWAPVIRSWRSPAPAVMSVALGRGPLLNGTAAALRLARRRFPVVLLANVANGLVPALFLLRMFGTAPRCVLIAHREPFPLFLRAQRRMPTTVVAVNRKIAAHFERMGYPRVEVYYGITDAARFCPPGAPRPDDRTVNFCVLGRLDNAWKGADTAVAAFRALPDSLRARCRLHLASFERPPAFPDAGIVVHPWMPFEQVPEFLRRMDVMLVPSRDEEVMRETFSQAVVQGMLSGLPVVVGNLPILTEKLDKGGGMVFDGVAALAQAMSRLAGDPALRRELGRQARQTALARYVWDTSEFVRRYLEPNASDPEVR